MNNDVLAIQETLVDQNGRDPKPSFSNMATFYQKNDRGVSLSANTSLLPQRVVELEDNLVDSIWITINYNSKLILIGNYYVNPNSTTNILSASLQNMTSARTYAQKYRLKNIIVIGDFNSRNAKWGDSTTNKCGKQLDEYICTNNLACISPNTWTFRHMNGGSVIDLAFTSPDISALYNSSSVDSDIELFSGSPFRGHMPVIHQFKNSNAKEPEAARIYKDLQNTNWKQWSAIVTGQITDQIGNDLEKWTDAQSLWDCLRGIISTTNNEAMPTKQICSHSKPFWAPELTVLSQRLLRAKKKLGHRTSPENRIIYDNAKTEFSTVLTIKKNCWIREQLENLNVAESRIFWKNYKKTLTGDKKEYLGNLEDKGNLLTDPHEKEDLLFRTFFEGSHLNPKEFDNVFYENINQEYSNISSLHQFEHPHDVMVDNHFYQESNESDCQYHFLNEEISLEEVKNSIRHQKPSVRSFDGDQLHPKIIKNLPMSGVHVLHRIFNLCFQQGIWVWNTSNVVFMKKVGKPNYMKPGAYRPITISSYIGKLLERILERRIRHLCDLDDLLDDEQEGFRETRNTTRYLYKLLASLKESQRRKFTTFLLCIDFEKAFDSVWLKGLIVKLNKWNLNGKLLSVINAFLFNRKVQININKHQGPIRNCNEYGLPQGSVLSPLLFIMFISDMFFGFKSSPSIRSHATTFKYADDGSVAITHMDPCTCYKLAQEVCSVLSNWCQKWRLVINCDKDKTECLIIKPQKCKTDKYSSIRPLFVGQKQIGYTDSSLVLGLKIDDSLTFNQHANLKLKQCWYSWYKLTRSSTRHQGLNVSSMAILFKTIVIPKLMYAAPVWLQDQNQQKFKKFFARVCLKISGSTHYAPQMLSMFAMGLDPIVLLYKLMCTKFLLKSLSSDNNMRAIILQLEESKCHDFYHQVLLVKEYLTLKDPTIVFRQGRTVYNLSQINPQHLIYTDKNIREFKISLWQDYLTSKADIKSRSIFGASDLDNTEKCFQFDNLSFTKSLFPRSSRRCTDTKVMALLHGHDLCFRNFRYKSGNGLSPFCETCSGKLDTNIHQLLDCPKYACSYRKSLLKLSPEQSEFTLMFFRDSRPEDIQNFRNMAQIIA